MEKKNINAIFLFINRKTRPFNERPVTADPCITTYQNISGQTVAFQAVAFPLLETYSP